MEAGLELAVFAWFAWFAGRVLVPTHFEGSTSM